MVQADEAALVAVVEEGVVVAAGVAVLPEGAEHAASPRTNGNSRNVSVREC